MSRSSRSHSYKKSGNKFLKLLIPLLAICVIVGGFFTIQLGPVDRHDDTEITVEIPTGTGASAIVDILNEKGLVKNRFCAKVNARIGGYNTLQANTYIFKKSMSFTQMMRAINKGDFEYISKETIELKDGMRLDQLAETMAEQLPYSKSKIMSVWNNRKYLKKLIKKYWFLTDEILNPDIIYPLEGYLYADTYFLTTENMTIRQFTEMCLDRMDQELTARKDEIEKSKFTVHELLSLTSIVTKEAQAPDQSHVAGVFMNRLKDGISLGSDVTVCYIYQEDRVELKVSQLENDSPYNTRKFAGLTPGPICSIVADALDATLNYDKTDDLFFFADIDGIVHFFKTQADFEKGLDTIDMLEDDEDKE